MSKNIFSQFMLKFNNKQTIPRTKKPGASIARVPIEFNFLLKLFQAFI
jgi:hypothetical protein